MTTTHVNSMLDIYAGITSGVNTSLGWPGDNNAAPAFEGGIGLNLLDGNLTVLATTHIGPENPKQLDPLGVGWPNTPLPAPAAPSSTLRFLNDMTVTWKATENLTFITDANYIHDNGWNTVPVIGGSNAALKCRPLLDLIPLLFPSGRRESRPMASRNTSPIKSTICSRSVVASKFSVTTITSSSPAIRATSTS